MRHDLKAFRPVVISLFDYTSEAVKPWAEAGYDCYCLDIQHDGSRIEPVKGSGADGRVVFQRWAA